MRVLCILSLLLCLSQAQKLWPGGVLKFELSSELDSDDKKIIRDTLKVFEEKLGPRCVQFEEADSGVRVVVTNSLGVGTKSECWADIGYYKHDTRINLGYKASRGCMTHNLIEHEFMHALGLRHYQIYSDDQLKIIKKLYGCPNNP